MKIGIIAPPWITVPPRDYGGIESVIYDLAEGLTELGEEVVLFAQKGSNASCKMYSYLNKPGDFGLHAGEREKRFVAELSSKYAYAMAGYEKVDIIHDHTLSLPGVDVPTVHTLHGPANLPTIKRCAEISLNPKNHFVTISRRQQEIYKSFKHRVNFIGTVHNSINVHKIPWSREKDNFYFFAGRANWEKGLDLAVRVAGKSRLNLVMAIKMSEQFEKDFFAKEVKPWINNFPKDLLFKIHEDLDKDNLYDFYQRAKCTLFTSQWEEPFGLVMIESLASGTPVIGLRRGAVPEVIKHGKTGFLVDNEEDMSRAVKKIEEIDPVECRNYAEKYFSRERLAKDYLSIYRKVLDKA